ncbi:MAG: hypothetical protein FWF50_05840 [Defluviitaleaceae bacterium]|nr:hypothetical protein [Defluviitaleaceae bacterium]
MGMTDGQFKHLMRTEKTLLEHAKEQETKEEVLAIIDVILRNIEKTLED